VHRTSDAIGYFAADPRMYQILLTPNAANITKLIQSITFTKTTTAANEVLHIFGVTTKPSLINNDVAVTAIAGLASGCGLTNQENVCVTIQNAGSAPHTNFPVRFTVDNGTPVTETFTGSLAPGATANYCFTAKANLSVPGNHTVQACTGLSNDVLPTNDCFSKAVTSLPTISAYPYVQNFETNDGGWVAGGIASSWAWGTPTKHVINSAASGTKVWATELTTFYNNNEKSYVISPCLNFSSLTQPVIEFKIWWQSENNFDGAVLQSSIDGGATWQNVGAKGDPKNWFNSNTIAGAPGGQSEGWTGRDLSNTGSGGWVTARHALTGLGGNPSVKLRVAFGSGAAINNDGFAFDDVMIYQSPAIDGTVTAITSPNSACSLTNQETVTITVANNGSSPISNIPVTYTINGTGLVSETIPGPIAPNASLNYSFTAKANLSVAGTYNIVAETNISGDPITGNDATTKVVTSIPLVSSLPYSQGFENGDGGWLPGGTFSSWALGTPAKSIINSAATGTKAWVTSLAGNYNPNEKSYVLSPCFDFSGKPDPDFEMKVWWNSQFSFDGAVLQSSIDGGATWQKVGAKGDPNNWYNDNTINGEPGGQPAATAQGWTGAIATVNGSNGWVPVKHRLTGLGGKSSVRLRIAFGSDATLVDNGFAFDDIHIGDNTNNLAVTSIQAINKPCGFNASEPITAVIENLGATAVSGFTVSYTVNGGTPITQAYAGSLAGGATANFTFTQGANLSNSGPYTIVVTVNSSSDPDGSNNSATYNITNAYSAGLPAAYDFESAATGIAQLHKVIKTKSNIVESTGASNGAGSTKGLIMDGVSNTGWVVPGGTANPWTINPENFSAIYTCFNPSGGPANAPLWLSFDLKQLFKSANSNTNFRVTINGTQVGPTYRPPFSGTPITWQRINVDLSAYKNLTSILVGLESSVMEAYAAGTGTANLIDNITFSRVSLGVKTDALSSQIHVYPNPGNGVFNVSLPAGKICQLEVTDMSGKKILTQEAKCDTQLNLEGIAKGIYLLQVSSENGSAIRKLIVE
jgi:hypothetical protein